MLILKNGGIVMSKRGSGGGFCLNLAPGDITLGDIIKLTEGPIDLLPGSENTASNPCKSVFTELGQHISESVHAIIDHITFSEVLRRIDEKKQSQEYNYII